MPQGWGRNATVERAGKSGSILFTAKQGGHACDPIRCMTRASGRAWNWVDEKQDGPRRDSAASVLQLLVVAEIAPNRRLTRWRLRPSVRSHRRCDLLYRSHATTRCILRSRLALRQFSRRASRLMKARARAETESREWPASIWLLPLKKRMAAASPTGRTLAPVAWSRGLH